MQKYKGFVNLANKKSNILATKKCKKLQRNEV